MNLILPVERSRQPLLTLLMVFSSVIILRNAWIGDDSYIGFRTVYNLVHGYGFTFNITERVQSFTNPLWLLLMSVFYFFTEEAYFTSIFLSLAVTLVALYYFNKRIINDSLTMIFVFVVVCSSKAFIDYSTSGLENSLGHLFLVLFAITYLQDDKTPRRLFLLFFIASLAAVNRLDNFILYIAPLASQFRQLRGKNILTFLTGMAPLIAWELFSLLYYGYPFPNTYYVKLHTGLKASEYEIQGIRYLVNSLDIDPVTLLTVFAAIALGIFYSIQTRRMKLVPLIISVLAYLFYVIRSGGDFMSGRFLTYIFLLSVIIISQLKVDRVMTVSFIAVALSFMLLTPYSPVTSNSQYRVGQTGMNEILKNDGIADERGYYYFSSGLMNMREDLEIIQVEKQLHTMTTHGDSIMLFAEQAVDLGFISYRSGPNVYFFHKMGLSDPLIARLPRDIDAGRWRIGHFVRKIPEGYPETLRTGINQIKDKNLAQYYDKLNILIKGPVFSWERFKTIYNMNTGKYDRLINRAYYSTVANQ